MPLTMRGRKIWERLLGVREEVLKALEQSRTAKQISAPLEACNHAGSGRCTLKRFSENTIRCFLRCSSCRRSRWSPRLDAGPQRQASRVCKSVSRRLPGRSAHDAGITRRTWAKARITRRCASAARRRLAKSTGIPHQRLWRPDENRRAGSLAWPCLSRICRAGRGPGDEVRSRAPHGDRFHSRPGSGFAEPGAHAPIQASLSGCSRTPLFAGSRRC